MTTKRRLKMLRLHASCPECGAPPAERLPVTERGRYEDLRPDRVVLMTKCNVCRNCYPLRAEAFARAA